MIVRPMQAMKEAFEEIEELGYVLIPGQGSEDVEVLWPRAEDPPDIESQIRIVEAAPHSIRKALRNRSVHIPMWLLLGYPWDSPLHYWKKLERENSGGASLESKKAAYASACVEFYKHMNSNSWKRIFWQEPWPIVI